MSFFFFPFEKGTTSKHWSSVLVLHIELNLKDIEHFDDDKCSVGCLLFKRSCKTTGTGSSSGPALN